MDVYYKRYKTWCKWPWNDVVDTDVVKFSTQKKKFDENVFLELDPQVDQQERKRLVSESLKRNVKKVNLIKLNF
jgi:hypothetical protein